MAVQPGLCRTRSETPKTGFLTSWLIYMLEIGAVLVDKVDDDIESDEVLYDQSREKTCFLHMQKQARISCAVTMQLISTFVFAT